MCATGVYKNVWPFATLHAAESFAWRMFTNWKPHFLHLSQEMIDFSTRIETSLLTYTLKVPTPLKVVPLDQEKTSQPLLDIEVRCDSKVNILPFVKVKWNRSKVVVKSGFFFHFILFIMITSCFEFIECLAFLCINYISKSNCWKNIFSIQNQIVNRNSETFPW